MCRVNLSISWLNSRAAQTPRLLLCLLLLAVLSGCGYGFAGNDSTVLGSGKATLKLTGIEQPTLYPWVGYTLRSAMRDEITARNIAAWVDGGSADYNMHLRVESFTIRSSVKSTTDATLLYDGTVVITAIVHNGSDNIENWRSTVTYSNTFETDAEDKAASQLFTQAVRRLADNMRRTF